MALWFTVKPISAALVHWAYTLYKTFSEAYTSQPCLDSYCSLGTCFVHNTVKMDQGKPQIFTEPVLKPYWIQVFTKIQTH